MFPLASKATLTLFTFLSLVAIVVSAPIPSHSRRDEPSHLVRRSVMDLSKFTLQTPDDASTPGNELKNNAFVKITDSSIQLTVPKGNCKTTANSKHCRTEFKENTDHSPSGTNTMTVTLSAQPDPGSSCIGQIFGHDTDTDKPLLQVYYHTDGSITLGVQQNKAGGHEKVVKVAQTVKVGTKFTYKLDFSKGKLGFTLNGKHQDLTPDLKYTPKFYFKFGDYAQGPAGKSESSVTVFSAVTSHS